MFLSDHTPYIDQAFNLYLIFWDAECSLFLHKPLLFSHLETMISARVKVFSDILNVIYFTQA